MFTTTLAMAFSLPGEEQAALLFWRCMEPPNVPLVCTVYSLSAGQGRNTTWWDGEHATLMLPQKSVCLQCQHAGAVSGNDKRAESEGPECFISKLALHP